MRFCQKAKNKQTKYAINHNKIIFVMQIEMVRYAVEKSLESPVTIRKVTRAKFTGECIPGENISVQVSLSDSEDMIKAKAAVKKDSKPCADLFSMHTVLLELNQFSSLGCAACCRYQLPAGK